MKTILSFALVAAAFSTPAFAITEVYAPRTTCHDLRHAVRHNGAVLVYSSDDIYDIVVSGSSYCDTGSYAKDPAYVGTSDNAACFAGFYCGQNSD